MDILVWLPVLARSMSVVLAAQGKTEQASLLNDAASAALKGKNVDDLMRQYAEEWEANGEPTFEQIAATRRAIQDRM